MMLLLSIVVAHPVYTNFVACGIVLQYDQPTWRRNAPAPVHRFDPDCTLAFSPQSHEEYQCLIAIPAFA
jgi:hypothetical protein